MNALQHWMSWEGGVDLVALTQPGLAMPNVIIHLGRMVHTPVGSAASGMVLWQPSPTEAPAVMGFVSTDEKVGAYFGPTIFAGTPFEQAPSLKADITIMLENGKAFSKIAVNGFVFEVEMSGLGEPYLINREPSAMPPFYQQGLEQKVENVTLKVNGEVISLIIPPVGITGGPAAVVSPTGLYTR